MSGPPLMPSVTVPVQCKQRDLMVGEHLWTLLGLFSLPFIEQVGGVSPQSRRRPGDVLAVR